MWGPCTVLEESWPVAHAHGSCSPAVDAKASNCHWHNHPSISSKHLENRQQSTKQLRVRSTARIPGDKAAKSKEPHDASPEPWIDRRPASALCYSASKDSRKLSLSIPTCLAFRCSIAILSSI